MELKAVSLVKRFQQGDVCIPVLNEVTVSFQTGKTYAITGCSGAGKSTLIHLLAGIEQADQGQVLLDGQSISCFSAYERAQFLNKSIGLVFQHSYLIRELTVLENVMTKGLIAGQSYQMCQTKARELLTQVGVGYAQDRHPYVLSGGEQQRVALARALFNEPFFLLADEPTANLDLQTGIAIIDLLLACQKRWGMGVIVCSHDDYVYERMEVVYELFQGQLSQKRAGVAV